MPKVRALLALLTTAALLPAQQSLGDLNPFTTDPDSSPGPFAALGNTVVFAATAAASGRELWGMPFGGQAQLLADLAPGSSDPEHLTWVGNSLFFVADDGAGRALWVFDGATAIVRKLRVLAVRPEAQGPAAHAVGSLLLCIADDGATGPELWRSDGTPAGTQLVADIEPGALGGRLEGATVRGHELFFAFRTPHTTLARTLLVRSDGTSAGTRVVTRSDQGGPEIRQRLVTANAQVFFAGSVGPVPNYELWASDGTAAGTRLVIDWDPNRGSFLGDLVSLGSRVAYVAFIPSYGEEPVLSDGTPNGSHIVDVNVLVGRGSTPDHLTPMGGDLYLFGSGLPGSGLYRIDTTRRSASLLASLLWQPALEPPIVAAGSRLFFRGVERSAASTTSAQLWVSDGTAAGTLPLRNLRRGLDAPRFGRLTAVGGNAIFAVDDGIVGQEPWQSDGTTPGTHIAANVHASAATQGRGSAPTFFLPARHATVFDADDGQRGREPWRTDGTAAGTQPLADLVPGGSGSELIALGLTRGEAIFASFPGGSLRADYYASDGSAAGTRRLAWPSLLGVPVPGSIAPDDDRAIVACVARLDGFGSSPQDWSILEFAGDGVSALGALQLSAMPGALTMVRGAAFFAADSLATGRELWVATGTARPVLDIRPGPFGSDPGASLRIGLGSALMFSADDGVHGVELWRSDGTAAGTQLVADLWPGASSGNPRAPVRFRDRVIFVADAPASGAELWITDGTAAGTQLLLDLRPGAMGSGPTGLVATPTSLWFSADDGVSGRELFVLDAAGARRVADLNPGAGSSNPRDLVPLGSRRLLFVADNGTGGEELWETDGSAAATRARFTRPGPTGSGARAVTVRGDGRVLFAADDGALGQEPWVFDAGAVAQPIAPGCGVPDTWLRIDDPVLGTSARVGVTRRDGGSLGGVFLLGLPRFDVVLGCTVHVDPTGIALGFAFQQAWSTQLAVPNVPSLRRTELRAQALLGPFFGPFGWSLSDAWSVQPGR